MNTTVGRIYRFRAVHSLPDFPEPWCFPHQHDYTVEIEAEGGMDTLGLDEWWRDYMAVAKPEDMDARYTPSTVENIANQIRINAPPYVLSVKVWEDRQRWGKAER